MCFTPQNRVSLPTAQSESITPCICCELENKHTLHRMLWSCFLQDSQLFFYFNRKRLDVCVITEAKILNVQTSIKMSPIFRQSISLTPRNTLSWLVNSRSYSWLGSTRFWILFSALSPCEKTCSIANSSRFVMHRNVNALYNVRHQVTLVVIGCLRRFTEVLGMQILIGSQTLNWSVCVCVFLCSISNDRCTKCFFFWN